MISTVVSNVAHGRCGTLGRYKEAYDLYNKVSKGELKIMESAGKTSGGEGFALMEMRYICHSIEVDVLFSRNFESLSTRYMMALIILTCLGHRWRQALGTST